MNPGSHQQTPARSPQPVNLPAVYVAGKKAGQNFIPSGVPKATLRGIGAGGLAHEPDPNKVRGKQRSFKISEEGWILLPDRKRGGPSGPQPPQPSKKRKIGVHLFHSLKLLPICFPAASRPSIPESSSHQLAELPIPSQIENQQPLVHHGAVNGTGFSVQSTPRKGVESRGGAQQAEEQLPPYTRSPRSGGSSLQRFTVSVFTGKKLEGGRLGIFQSFPNPGKCLTEICSWGGVPVDPRSIHSSLFRCTSLETVNRSQLPPA